MNAPTPKNLFFGASAAPRRNAGDMEFLPAALEIIEAPPSPVRMALISSICALVVASVAWAYFGRIDIVAIAQGKIQSTGRVKVVQPVETAKVRAIFVTNGQRVAAGDMLVQFDDSEARAEETALANGVTALKAEALRRSVALSAARSHAAQDPDIDWPQEIPQPIRERENKVLRGDLAQLKTALESLSAQKRQKEMERSKLRDTIVSQEELLVIQQQRVEMRTILERSKAGSRASLIDAQETLQQQKINLTQQMGQVAESGAAIGTLDREMAKLVEAFAADNTQKMAEAERQMDDMSQRLLKARVRMANTSLSAPVAGLVQNLAITTVGQIVMTGDELMRIVPDDSQFEIECYLANKDIGFVAVGQRAIVKVESFPFTRYGSLPAEVTRVGNEAIPEQDAQAIESAGGKPTGRAPASGGSQRVQNLVFPLTLKPMVHSIDVDGAAMQISNGMAVTVEIRTGSRRIIDYVFAPLVEVTSKALKER